MSSVISIKNFYKISDDNKSTLIDELFYSKFIHDSGLNSTGVSTNFKVLKDSLNISNKIYDKFLKISRVIFGNITLPENNNNSCWSLCTNKDYWASVPHNHLKSCTINAVFYLNIPKIDGKYCGKILFYDNNKWNSYQPEPGELLIMPNHLMHDTEYHDTDEFRISLNFEITCNEDINWNIEDWRSKIKSKFYKFKKIQYR